MPRLNLEIFGGEAPPPEQEPQGEKTGETKGSRRGDTTPGTGPAPVVEAHAPAVRFIPVGFHERHLRLLDDAVLALRRHGHWKASKSGIIRALIERHSRELDAIWLRPPPSAPDFQE